MVAADFSQIARVGFDHVRVPITPEYLGFSIASATVAIDLTAVDQAVDLALANGLAVIIDMHPRAEVMSALERSDESVRRFISLWRHVIDHYLKYSPDDVAFELLNEPQFYRRTAAYYGVATQLVRTLRSVAPNHYLLIAGPEGSDIDDLLKMPVLDDPRLWYVFHFYEPYIITHQGVPTGFEGKAIRWFRSVPYPSRLVQQGRSYAPSAPDQEEARREVDRYISESWDSSRINDRIHTVGLWAQRHHVHVMCTEFGASRVFIDPDSRYRWIRDARRALEANSIGWDLWDYADTFGISRPIGVTITDSFDGSVRFARGTLGRRPIEAAATAALFGQ